MDNLIKQNINEIKNLAQQLDHVKLMELCGTHSQTVAKYNLKSLLPKNIELISGPGCPICVTDQQDIDVVIGLALNNIPIAIYGDALTLPGSQSSLEKTKQQGKNIFVVYSTEDALKLQKQFPKIIFFGIGFETTTPMTAWAIRRGLTVYSSHKLFPPAMEALLKNKNIQINGFINPGHVSAIIGTEIYNQFKFPQIITGFEPEDVIESIKLLLEMIIKKKNKVINQYTRVVTKKGNKKALDLINEVFYTTDTKWRGLGTIPNSGLKIKKEFQNQDAEFIYDDLIANIKKENRPMENNCICGQILQGIKKSSDCPLFKKTCTPETPQGACMVSVEGACQINYKYS
jgi:hydrogenase expression/formation protein HypD